jgi:hypothetical protein
VPVVPVVVVLGGVVVVVAVEVVGVGEFGRDLDGDILPLILERGA